jgi:hypothetical protein
MPTLRDIASQAVDATRDDPEGNLLSSPEIFRLLDVVGTRNTHLANPLNLPPWNGCFRARESPLTGEEAVNGDFLTLTYCHHDPFVRLHDFASRVELEERLLCPGGILHPMINYLVAFVAGKVAPYRVTFRGLDGSIRTFDKYQQHREFLWSASMESQYPCARIHWLET